MGEYLFTDSGFVKSLSTKNPNLFKRIYEEIKYLTKTFAGTKQGAALEKVKKTFAELYRDADVKNTAQTDGVRYTLGLQNPTNTQTLYDFTKSFADQLSDYQQGKIRADDSLVIGATPDILKKIGMVGLPMTINQKHIGDALNGTYKGTPQEVLDHTFTPKELATLPEKIADPIAVIYDKRTGKATASESTVDVIVEMTAASGKQVLVAVQINGNGRINGIRIDTNKVATVHGNTDCLTRLIDAINENEKGNVSVFYINNDKTTKVLQRTGNPIPSGLSNLDGFLNSINDPGSPVKSRFSNVTETQQFKRWFGDWQNHTENASKVVNDDGTPKIVYHGSDSLHSVFSYGNIGSASGTPILGEGFYFTDNVELAKSYGENVYECYLQIKTPYYATEADAYKLNTNTLATQGYDGVILETTNGNVYMAIDNTQIKSATDNIGTFDGNNPDIRYSLSEQQAAPTGGYRITGEDIALAPTKEDIAEQERIATAQNAPRNDAEELGAPTREDILRMEQEKKLKGPLQMKDSLDRELEKLYRLQQTGKIQDNAYFLELSKVNEAYQAAGRDLSEALSRVVNAYQGDTINRAAATANEDIQRNERRLTDDDLVEYMRVGERKHVRDEKQKIVDAGDSPILTRPSDIVAFIRNALYGKARDVVKAYGRANGKLAKAVNEATNGTVNIDDYYLELDANRIAHMKDHVGEDKDNRNIPLTEEQIEQIPAYVDNFDDLIDVIRRKDGSVRLMLGKKINGHSIIVETVSKGRKALHPVTAYQVDTSDYISKYKTRAIDRSSTSRSANADTVDISRPATAPADTSIPKDVSDVKQKEVEAVLGEKDAYVSKQANELYDEVKSMQKGKRVSNGLSYLLDTLDLSEEHKAESYGSLRTALLNIRDNPNQVVNPNSAVEAAAREMFGREYDSMAEEFANAEGVAKERLTRKVLQKDGVYRECKTPSRLSGWGFYVVIPFLFAL